MKIDKNIHKAGEIADYGQLISLEGKYKVKQRQDLLDLLPKNRDFKSIIEFGCADGTNLIYFSEKLNIKLREISGVDICSSIDNHYQEFNFYHQSAEDFLENNNNFFDLILLSDVLEHIYNPWKMLNKIKSRLNPNGCILISLPNLQNLNYLKAVNSGEFNYAASGLFDETHIRFFSLKSLKYYLEELDYKIISTSFRPDYSLSEIRKAALVEIRESKNYNFCISNLSIKIDESNLDLYVGQQVLICAANE
jgi:2-polyprenyl-3-methyl-5-hydroxy-6-metoxy-1,4-benzoquinol methylase